MATSGDEREHSRPITGLGRHCQMIALGESQRERETLPYAWTWRHRHDTVDVGIAVQNPGGIFEHEDVDDGLPERASQACDKGCRKEHVAEPAQGHHQDARAGRQVELLHEYDSDGTFSECPAGLNSPTLG